VTVASGTRLGPYKILSLLGAGGMGKVYLAEDLRLSRKVALKLLPAQFTKDEDRVRRFEQEARAASALNHPNIITIYEIGQMIGVHFMATEFIDGLTLRGQMEQGRLKVRETLEVIIQVTSALAAAHAAGITHRDIKPENIMLRTDGYIKVLDFGLAKLSELPALATDSNASTTEMPDRADTDPGKVLGTINYMSPEQAQGLKVDARTDIFSLGIVFYEMVTGHLPFDGATVGEVIGSILNREPAPVTRYLREVPAELERIIAKALAKDREERYQTVKDLLIDLKKLKRRLEFEAEFGHVHPSEAHTGNGVVTAQLPAVGTKEVAAVRTTSSAEYLISEIKRHKRGVATAVVTLSLMMAAIIYFASNRAIDSLAVLPQVISGAGPNVEYLSEDITAGLIHSLSKLPNLEVKPQSAILRFKGREMDPVAVGHEIGAHAVLVLRFAQRGDEVAISAELVDARHKNVLWGDNYSLKLADTLAVKEHLAREITEKLSLRLSGEERKRQEVDQLYDSGVYYLNQRNAKGLNKAIETFKQVLAKDANHALAYAGLADCYNVFNYYSSELSPKETYPKAKEYALKAIQLDDRLGEAHNSLAYALWYYDQNWAEAEREFKRAIQLKPTYATAHQWYAEYLVALGRFDESIAEMKRATQLDPLSRIIRADLGSVYYSARNYDQAIEEFRKTLEMDPNFTAAHWWMAEAYIFQGKYDDAVTKLNKTIALSPDTTRMLADLGYTYAVSGRPDEARKILARLHEQAKQLYVSPYETAVVYAGLGEKDQAFADLQRALEDRPWDLLYLKVEPMFESLHADPRFGQLLRRLKLPA